MAMTIYCHESLVQNARTAVPVNTLALTRQKCNVTKNHVYT